MSRREQLELLRKCAPLILPSLLLCDFGNLEREVDRLQKAGVRAFHLDVMDGNFVPNLTYGMPIVAGLRQLTDYPLDVHLMIADPARYLEAFVEAGADLLTVHVEACDDPRAVLEQIRRLGAGAGIALNPGTPLSQITSCLPACDLVLVMSVEAGFGGQPFESGSLDKLRWLRNTVDGGVLLEVDGGINSDTIGWCSDAGADLFVVGSAIFRSDNYGPVVDELTQLVSRT